MSGGGVFGPRDPPTGRATEVLLERFGREQEMERDGFVISTHEGEEVDFIPCSKDGRMREKVEDGLLRRVDLERFTFGDTRDEG